MFLGLNVGAAHILALTVRRSHMLRQCVFLMRSTNAHGASHKMTEKESQEGSPWRSVVNTCCYLRGQFYHFNTIKLEQQPELQRHGGSWEWVDLRGDLHAVNTVMMALRVKPGRLAEEEQRESFQCEQCI